MLTRKSVNPFAYGPGSTDILVTFEEENGKLRNWPVENAGTLQAQYRKLDADRPADYAERRAKLDGDAFALAEKAMAEHT